MKLKGMATHKQLAYLDKLGVKYIFPLTKQEASDMISFKVDSLRDERSNPHFSCVMSADDNMIMHDEGYDEFPY